MLELIIHILCKKHEMVHEVFGPDSISLVGGEAKIKRMTCSKPRFLIAPHTFLLVKSENELFSPRKAGARFLERVGTKSR